MSESRIKYGGRGTEWSVQYEGNVVYVEPAAPAVAFDHCILPDPYPQESYLWLEELEYLLNKHCDLGLEPDLASLSPHEAYGLYLMLHQLDCE